MTLCSSMMILLCLPLLTISYAAPPETDTEQGKVRGYSETVLGHTVNVFLGIPYAKPPVGDLRFQKPQPPEPWASNGVYNATHLPRSCWQTPDETFGDFAGSQMWNPNTAMSEDCLYLNVWSPADTAPTAVMVWIYGGAFSSGTSTLPIYDGRILAAQGGVVVVSMQYRLGPLGFLYMGEAIPTRAPGNMGLLDQTRALWWVQNNIANFGGDPGKVTIFGESAGSISAAFHLLLPLSAPLFHNAIMQSGSPFLAGSVDDPATAQSKAEELAELVGCDSNNAHIIACLQSVSPELLTEKQWNIGGNGALIFVPTIDGIYLTDSPHNLMTKGQFKQTDILLGSNKNEGTYFLVYEYPDQFPIDSEPPVNKKEFLEMVSSLEEDEHVRPVLEFVYTEACVNNRHSLDYRILMDDIRGDKAFVCPVNKFAQIYAEAGLNVYKYEFGHVTSANPWPAWMGVMHGYEIDHVFGLPLNTSLDYRQNETRLSKLIIAYWSNFAKHGDPSAGSADLSATVKPWPVHTAVNREYVELITISDGALPVTRHGLRSHQCAFWNNLRPQLHRQEDMSRSTASTAWYKSSFTWLPWMCTIAVLHHAECYQA